MTNQGAVARAITYLVRFYIALVMFYPPPAYAQNQPSSLSIVPASVLTGESYTMTVGNGANMTLDIQYKFNGGAVETIYDWPTLNAAGQATIWTDSDTVPGTYTFVAIRNSLNSQWVTVAAALTVASIKPQPTSLSVNPSAVSQGRSYTLTAGNGANMTLDVQYRFNGGGIQTIFAWPTLNSSAQASIQTDSQTELGTYTFIAVRNTENNDWVPVNVTLTVLPRQPTSLSIPQSSVTAGQGYYSMIVGNGENMTLDVQYRLNGGLKQTLFAWPALNSSGVATLWPDSCASPGTYTYTDIRNTLNTEWIAVNAQITISAAAAPSISSVAPSGTVRGSSVSVTISGSNLCGSSLSTTWPGLSFSNIVSANDTSLTALFITTGSAAVGPAAVTLTAHGLATTFFFAITNNLPPTVSGISPSSGGRGSSLPVLISGTNLNGGVLTTAWAGLTFASIAANTDGTSMTAIFDVSPTAALGSPAIQLATPAGSTALPNFSIVDTTNSAREYVYFGAQVVAVLPATAPQPPSTPSSLTAQYTSPTTAQVAWTPASNPGTGGLAGYKLYRDGILISGSAPITTTAYQDPTLSPNTAYSHFVVAVDRAGNTSSATAPKSVFRDDFNRANTAGFANTSWASYGRWNLDTNQAKAIYQQTLSSGWTDAFSTKLFGSFRATLRITTPASFRGVGLSFWSNSAGEKYRVYLWNDAIYLTYRDPTDGVYPGWVSAPVGTIENCTIRVETESASRTIRVFYNGNLKITYKEGNTTRPNSGIVAISAYATGAGASAGGPVTVDDFVVEQPWN